MPSRVPENGRQPAAPLCGGTVPAHRVVGRDAKIKEIWGVLDRQSVLLTAERRIGKTAILNKLAANPPAGWKVIYSQVEGTSSPEELIKDLQRDLQEALGGDQSIFIQFKALYKKIGLEGMQLGSITLPAIRESWKEALLALLTDAGSVTGCRVVIIWDEFPNMVWKIAQRDPGLAADLVDVLRASRQSHASGVRFVFAGSIGFNLVLRYLLDAKAHRGRPINDLRTIHAGALAPEHAAQIAREGLEYLAARDVIRLADSVERIAMEIATAADCLPFYVEHLVTRLEEAKDPLTVGHVLAARERLIRDDTGNNDFRHYRNRILDHYPEAERDLCVEVLNKVALHPLGLTKDEILARMNATPPLTRHRLATALDLLLDDHYLHAAPSDAGGRLAFKYPLVRDWWTRDGA